MLHVTQIFSPGKILKREMCIEHNTFFNTYNENTAVCKLLNIVIDLQVLSI